MDLTVNTYTNYNGNAVWNGNTNTVTVNAFAGDVNFYYCSVAIFDWATGDGGHYDARAARSCLPQTRMYGAFLTDRALVLGMQRFGVCQEGYQLPTNDSATVCKNDPRKTCTVAGVPLTWCSWSVAGDGYTPEAQVQTCTGGDPRRSAA